MSNQLTIEDIEEYDSEICKSYVKFNTELKKCKKIKKSDKITMYLVSGKLLKKSKKCIRYSLRNREIDEKHVSELKKKFNPDLCGPIYIAKYADEMVYRILDGQHRFNAIKESNKKYNDFLFYLGIINISNKTEFAEFFNSINSNYTFKNTQLKKEKKIEDVILKLKSYFSKITIFSRNRPNIDKHLFKEFLTNNNFFASKKNNADIIFRKLININNTLLYLLKNNCVLQNTCGSKDLTENMIKKSIRNKMTLGLDREYSFLRLLNCKKEYMCEEWKKYIQRYISKKRRQKVKEISVDISSSETESSLESYSESDDDKDDNEICEKIKIVLDDDYTSI